MYVCKDISCTRERERLRFGRQALRAKVSIEVYVVVGREGFIEETR